MVSKFIGTLMIILATLQLISLRDPLSFEPKRMAIFLLSVLPGAVIIKTSFYLSERKIHYVISFLCIVIFMFGISIGLMEIWFNSSGPFRDIKHYEYILRENDYPELKGMDHFPKEIPISAVNVEMLYGRAMFQAPTSLKLRMGLSDKEFKEVLSKFKIDEKVLPKVKKDTSDLSRYKLQSQIDDYWALFIFDEYIDVFPDDFYFREFDRNSGVAVSLPRKEVLYWYSGGH